MTHWKESHKGVHVVTSLRMCMAECTNSLLDPIIFNLKPVLNRTQRAQQMNKLSLTSWCAVASPPAWRWEANRHEAEMSAEELVIAQMSNRLVVAAHSRRCYYQQILLCWGTVQQDTADESVQQYGGRLSRPVKLRRREMHTWQLSDRQFMSTLCF